MHRIVLTRVVLIAAAVVALAACGGSASSSTATSTTAGASGAGGANSAALRTCLSKHGVKLPANAGNGQPPAGGFNGQPPEGGFNGQPPSGGGTPPSFPGGADSSKLQAALKACGGGTGFRPGANSQAFQAYASCMRDHGVDIGSAAGGPPSTTAGGTSPTTIDRNSSKFVAANKTCRALLPSTTPTTAASK